MQKTVESIEKVDSAVDALWVLGRNACLLYRTHWDVIAPQLLAVPGRDLEAESYFAVIVVNARLAVPELLLATNLLFALETPHILHSLFLHWVHSNFRIQYMVTGYGRFDLHLAPQTIYAPPSWAA
jgi:hypothetical protein